MAAKRKKKKILSHEFFRLSPSKYQMTIKLLFFDFFSSNFESLSHIKIGFLQSFISGTCQNFQNRFRLIFYLKFLSKCPYITQHKFYPFTPSSTPFVTIRNKHSDALTNSPQCYVTQLKNFQNKTML